MAKRRNRHAWFSDPGARRDAAYTCHERSNKPIRSALADVCSACDRWPTNAGTPLYSWPRILAKIESGDPSASSDLLPLVYAELRRLAARQLQDAPLGNSAVQPTALVHEAFLRLVDQKVEQRWSHRGHFYTAAAESMRRILVDNARRKRSIKRGGGRQRVPLEEADIADRRPDPDVVALDEALTELADRRPEIARLVSLRYFAGLSMDQAAKVLEISPRTAARNWAYAKVWLLEAMRGAESNGAESNE